ncbi:MAG: hypothetical protein JWM80_6471 [Cyanobacteria bacterium RYN_339]|nr:hypothetical protein [Cyanobacteria bacterium RYN_339]
MLPKRVWVVLALSVGACGHRGVVQPVVRPSACLYRLDQARQSTFWPEAVASSPADWPRCFSK